MNNTMLKTREDYMEYVKSKWNVGDAVPTGILERSAPSAKLIGFYNNIVLCEDSYGRREAFNYPEFYFETNGYGANA